MDEKKWIDELEDMYSNILKENEICIDISNIDFLGINIKEQQTDFPFEFKVYYEPDEKPIIKDNDHQLIRFAFKNDMVKYRCVVKGTQVSRSYVVLKKNINLNMFNFLNKLVSLFPNMNKEVENIPSLIEGNDLKYLPIHILGVKTDNQYRTAINLEWMLRDYVENNNYKYNDSYYLAYILNLKSKYFSYLVNFIKEIYGKVIESGKMHLWLMAIDYFPNYNCIYKLYVKLDGYNIYIAKLIEKYFAKQYNLTLVDSIKKFLKLHSELKLYGFAIGIDSKGQKSINIYFVSAD